MAKKHKNPQELSKQDGPFPALLTKWLGFYGIFIASSLFLFTHDSAQVKITLFFIAAAGAAALFVNTVICKKLKIFSRFNLALLFPFVLYFAYSVISFFFHPYITARLGALAVFAAGSVLFTTAAFCFNYKNTRKFFSYVIAAAWIVSVYGCVQIADIYLWHGADFLAWTDFFRERIFSTIANPNFLGDFCVFCFFITAGTFIENRSRKLLVLMLLLLVNIVFTLSKGAWLALGFGIFVFGVIYFNFFYEKYKNNRLKYNLLLGGILLCAILAAGIFSVKRAQSVSFRLFTWRSAFEMIEASPVTGMGIGSFIHIYPSYKRPEIFYMEGVHKENTQTQHAENYFIEQACTLGIFGLALFLLTLLWQISGFIKKMKFLDGKEHQKDRLLLLTAFCACAVIYAHNLVDVSIYFVSTGYFLALFNGILFALNFGPLQTEKSSSAQIAAAEVNQSGAEVKPAVAIKAKYQKERGESSLIKQPQHREKQPSAVLKYLRIVFIILFIVFAGILLFYIGRDFYEMSAPALKGKQHFFFIFWAGFITVVLYTLWTFIKEALQSRRLVTVFIFSAAFGVMYLSFQPFAAGFYEAAAVSLSIKGDKAAPYYYNLAIKHNPFAVGLYQSSGIAFQNRADMSKSNRPAEGDPAEGFFDDYDRALRRYRQSLSFTPNDVLIHYNLGALYHDMAKNALQKQDLQAADEYYKLAEENLKKSLLLDPVYDNAYYHLANIAIEHRDFRRAANWVQLYIQGPEEVTNPLYLSVHNKDEKALSALKNILAAGGL